jgi:hypothetical protein
MPRPKPFAVLVVALVLAFPGTALAQSAGDQQYSDPFANQGGGGSSSGGGGGGQSSGAQSSGGSGSTGQSSAGQGGDTGSSATSATSGTQTSTGGSARELPRTGGEPGLVALFGAGLTLGGFGLRRWVRRPSE